MENLISDIRKVARYGVLPVVWFVVLKIKNSGFDFASAATWKEFPLAVSIYVIIESIFVTWLWRWKIFQFHGWAVKTPYIGGEWSGELISTWTNPETKQLLPPIPTTISIRQTLNSVKCVLKTKESESWSIAAKVAEDDGRGVFELSYTYVNKPKATVRSRSEIHYGAAVLQIVHDGTELTLAGDYWTDRKTTGTMVFKRPPSV